MIHKILIIDNEVENSRLLTNNFERDGYKVYCARTGKEGFSIAKKIIPDLIFLDVMLPDIDGIEVCELLRAQSTLSNSFIFFLSARGEDYSQVAGYKAGGDDYIVKPIRIRVLLHKVKALLERNKDQSEGKIIQSVQLDLDRYSVIKDGEESILPKKEFELLSYLMSVPNRVFRREEILLNVWGESQINDRTIDVHVRKLREKFGMGVIRTVKGVGYRYFLNS